VYLAKCRLRKRAGAASSSFFSRAIVLIALENKNFYRDLPEFAEFANVCNSENYSQVPDSWDLVITDVQGSTKAIEAGHYKDVNAAGVAAIVVVRNCMKDVDIPFVFGGDGATLLTPAGRRPALQAALRGLRIRCKAAYNLKMRVGIVPISRLRSDGANVSVARYAASPLVSFAMLSGEGVDLGERWIKDPQRCTEFSVSDDGDVFTNFEGFECRWKAIPSRYGLVASILVKALAESEEQRNAIYTNILRELENIAEIAEQGRPVSPKNLKLASARCDYDAEAILKTGSSTSDEAQHVLGGIRKQLRVGKVLLATGISAGGFHPREYKRELVANTDFRKFDNVLRMHLDLRRAHLDRLRELLQRAEDQGLLAYGIHTAQETLITCVVDSYQGSHAHFVDGAAGGYALAAKRLKTILKAQ